MVGTVIERGRFTVVIVDESSLARLGLAVVVGDAGGEVVVDTDQESVALSTIQARQPDLLIVGDHPRLRPLVEKAFGIAPLLQCLALTSPATGPLRPLLSTGVQGAVPRTAARDEISRTIAQVAAGERILSPTLVPVLVAEGRAATPMPVAELDPGTLTNKERSVLDLLATGADNSAIAKALFISGSTVKTHLAHIYAKLEAGNRHDAVARAVTLGLLGQGGFQERRRGERRSGQNSFVTGGTGRGRATTPARCRPAPPGG